jgi:hypothetical protein
MAFTLLYQRTFRYMPCDDSTLVPVRPAFKCSAVLAHRE